MLRDACRAQHCPSDPASDLAAVVRARHDGPELLDTLTAFSIVAPAYPGILAALRAARQGHPARLDRIVAAVRRGQRAPAAFLSQGLHASTLCGDLRAPWGGPDAPLPGRETALHAALARLAPAQTYPFDHATAEGNGIAQTCVRWPPVPSPDLPPPGKKLPAVPVLLLAGDHDLSTPLEWARQEAALAPRGNLVVIHTYPGMASTVAAVLDQSGPLGLLGTIAGDDTVFAVGDEMTNGKTLAKRILAMKDSS